MSNHTLPKSWTIVTAEQIAAEGKSIVSGPFGSNISSKFFVESGVPVIRGNNLTLGEKPFIDEGYVFITDDKAYELRNCEAVPGDLVFTAAGTLGQVGLIPEHPRFPRYIISNKQMRLRPNPKVALPAYLYYWFSNPAMQQHVESLNTGSSIPLINLSILRGLPVNLPPLPIQRRIAAVLSAYDDLIEVNQQRIEALEAAAQALYREWFVEMRFPGHESAEWVESELGVIPAGWEVRQVNDVVETVGGGTPRTKHDEYWVGGDINWYTPSDLTSAGTMFIEESERKINELGLENSSAKMFPAFSVMMTSRATIGVVAINTTPACVNQGFITCVPNNRLSKFYIYYWIHQNLELIDRLSSGATYKEMRKSTFRELYILVPNEEVHQQFVELVEPLGQEILNLQRRNVVLRQTRDLLLPRLISGEVSVEGLPLPGEVEA